MRKIESKEKKLKKQRKNQTIVGGILILLMLLSIAGYSFGGRSASSSTSQKINYGGYEFQNQNGLWTTQFEGGDLFFSISPSEISQISSGLNSWENYVQKPLYIYSENAKSETEVYYNLGQFALRVQNACYNGLGCEGDLPEKTCEDNLIVIQISNLTKVSQMDNCVFISAPESSVLSTVDGALLRIFGIVQ